MMMTGVTSTRVGDLAAAASVLMLLMLPRAHSTCQSVVLHSAGVETYETLINETQLGSRDHLVFLIKGTTSVGIGLAEKADPTAPMYKVVFGGGSNQKSIISFCSNGGNNSCTRKQEVSDSPLDVEKYVTFWIKWTATQILAGNGNTVGVNKTIQYGYSAFTIRALLFGGYGGHPYSLKLEDDSYCTTSQPQSTTETPTETTKSTTELFTKTSAKATEFSNPATENSLVTLTETSQSNTDMSAEPTDKATEATADISNISTETIESNKESQGFETTSEMLAEISGSSLEISTDSKTSSSEASSDIFNSSETSTELPISPLRSASQTSPSMRLSQTFPTESVSQTSPTENVSQTSPTESVSQTSPTENVSQTSPTESVSQTSSTESVSQTSPTDNVSDISQTPTTSTVSTSTAAVLVFATLKLTQEQRPCACVPVDQVDRDPAVLEQEKQEAADAISRELRVPSRNVSSYTRSKTSAGDDRDSSAAMGLVGIVACSVPLALVVLMDLCKALGCLGQVLMK